MSDGRTRVWSQDIRRRAVLENLPVNSGLERDLLRIGESVSSNKDGSDGGRVV